MGKKSVTNSFKDSKTIEMGYFPRTFGLDPKGIILLSGDLWP